MAKVYKKSKIINKKKLIKFLAILTVTAGSLISIYIFLPLLSWQIYFAPVFANQEVNSPIPKSTIVNMNTSTMVESLITKAGESLSGTDYTNANNWFPNHKFEKGNNIKTKFYKISIPAINITNALVSTIDINLNKNLVNYGGTAIPPQKGNAVIFGHSTLPQLYEEDNYKTIFSNLYKLKNGDSIEVNIDEAKFKYVVENIIIVDPNNTSVLEQNFDGSFITLITCTPPGTIWKRLVVKARLVNNT